VTRHAASRHGDPAAAYEARLGQRRAAHARLGRFERAISAGRGLVFVLGALCWWLAVGPRLLSPAWLGGAAAAFLVLVVLHERVIQSARRLARAVAFYERGLARLDDRWSGASEGGERYLPAAHAFAEDLDLFGPASLFQRLGAPRTRIGQGTLARWLCEPAGAAEVQARQEAVAELRGALDFREQLAVIGDDVRLGLDPEALSRWATRAGVAFPRGTATLCSLLSALSLLSLVAWFAFELGAGPFLAVALLQIGVALSLHSRVHQVVGGIDRPGRELVVLGEALQPVERQRFDAARLRQAHAALASEAAPPSVCIGRLLRRVELLESRRNPFFAPLAALLLWETQLAMAIESWRRSHGSAVTRWLRVVGELEALSTLAGYAFESPEDPFPELVETGPLFEATALGHPLIPKAKLTRNDVRLDAKKQVLVVSGSNMSGKTTLLRSVGVNTVLALCGAPVRAERLRLSPLTIGAIRVHDSLQEGTSRFYAEITRLRTLMDLARARPPLLFLLDEVLHGTNSSDRRAGAEALVHGFVARGAIGLVTTHDLALADVAEGLAPRARNVHFEDHLEGDRIVFDYRLREGVVRKSNALALMRAIGLEV
jgi:hypothetical protein